MKGQLAKYVGYKEVSLYRGTFWYILLFARAKNIVRNTKDFVT